MSDTEAPRATTITGDSRLIAIICYALFIAVFTNGITSIIGVVLAYIKRDESRGTIWESHFNNLISVFWTSLAVFVLTMAAAAYGAFGIFETAQTGWFHGAILLLPVLYVGGVLYLVWYLYKTVKGLVQALENKPYS